MRCQVLLTHDTKDIAPSMTLFSALKVNNDKLPAIYHLPETTGCRGNVFFEITECEVIRLFAVIRRCMVILIRYLC